MVTVDFAEVESLQHAGGWTRLAALLAKSAEQLERAGADFIVLCTNTMHKLAESITGAVQIPLLHIVDVTAAAIKQSGHMRVGLLATRITMEQAFYGGRMRDRFGIEVIVPSSKSREVVHDVIYRELCHGEIRQQSRETYQEVIRELGEAGAESIILGCTEIELLISAADCKLAVYPSTQIHAAAAVEFALG